MIKQILDEMLWATAHPRWWQNRHHPTAEQVWDAWVCAVAEGKDDVALCLLGAAMTFHRKGTRVSGARKRKERSRRAVWLLRARAREGALRARRFPEIYSFSAALKELYSEHGIREALRGLGMWPPAQRPPPAGCRTTSLIGTAPDVSP